MIPEQTHEVVATVPKVALSEPGQEGTYAIAHLLMKLVHFLLSLVGLENNETLFTIVYAALVFLIAIGVGYAVKWIVMAIMRHLGKHLHALIYGYLVDEDFFTKISRLIPAVVFLIFIQFTLNGRMSIATWLTRLTWIYICFIVANSLCLIINVIWKHINERANKRHLPLNGLAQLVKGIIWIIFAIIIVAVLFDKSPASLLAGLGAFAAVLMLVFKDSILGVVAGVQLSENDSLHVGDWIKAGDANGTVMEVSLTAVKIQNWDKTTTTLPPYNLVSNGFTNYRTMQQSNTRRIQRSYMIDADSVVPCDDVLLAEFSKIPMMKDWIEKKVAQKKAGKEQNAANPDGLVDGSIDTNLGVFRAYLKMYLDSNPNIASTGAGNDCFITTLPQTPYGIPLQIYCFTSTSKWIPYEAIMSSLFEHIAVMLYRFHLYTYESPSGRDTIIDGFICPGKNPDVVFGMPYPFFQNGGSPENPCYPMPQSSFPQPAAMQPVSNPEPAAPDPAGAQGATPGAAAGPASPAAPAAPATPV
ncbi:MAG: mechanosensitive ion channel family protein [Muribaculaceae bacterium]|nr:mechanosensitive ion channel family protein [Muribaculaceae bacterium]